jgi:imidazolonepropionase-like amidohydrolase
MAKTSVQVTADWLIDGTGDAARRSSRVTVTGEKIQVIEAETAGHSASTDWSFPGCSILPGLIDAHVHLTFAALGTHEEVVRMVSAESETELTARAIANAQAALRCGVTTLRDCGGPHLSTIIVREAIRKGHVLGPDILASGRPITTRKGHLHYIGILADSETEVRAAAERLMVSHEKADFLKIVATGGNMTAGSDRFGCQYDTNCLRAAVEVGRKNGVHTAAHVLSPCALGPCIDAGVHTIEHCSWRVSEGRYVYDSELARRLVANGQYVGFTMSAPTWRKVVPGMAGLDNKLMGDLDDRFETERRAINAGVKYLLHTDAGVRQTPFGPSLALGAHAAVHELGLTPMEAIAAVTRIPAEAVGLTDRGVLQPGKRADLIVVEGNPLVDMGALVRVKAVMRAGQMIWVDGKLCASAR